MGRTTHKPLVGCSCASTQKNYTSFLTENSRPWLKKRFFNRGLRVRFPNTGDRKIKRLKVTSCAEALKAKQWIQIIQFKDDPFVYTKSLLESLISPNTIKQTLFLIWISAEHGKIYAAVSKFRPLTNIHWSPIFLLTNFGMSSKS